MQSPPFPRYLVPPRSKYSPQHHVLKHPQLPFLPQYQRPNFTPIQNNRQNYGSIYILIFKFLDSNLEDKRFCTHMCCLHHKIQKPGITQKKEYNIHNTANV